LPAIALIAVLAGGLILLATRGVSTGPQAAVYSGVARRVDRDDFLPNEATRKRRLALRPVRIEPDGAISSLARAR